MCLIEGVTFNDTSNFRLQIVEHSEAILGDNLLGIQVGNEPDLYVAYAPPFIHHGIHMYLL